MLPVNKIAVIHIAKTQTGMTDDEYKAMLSSYKNCKGKPVTSSKELAPHQFVSIMDRFKALGFTNQFNKKHRTVTGSVHEKVNAIRLDLGLSWAYVDGIVKRRFVNVHGQPIKKFEWLNTDEQMKVLQMLIIHQRRQEEKEAENDNTKPDTKESTGTAERHQKTPAIKAFLPQMA